MMDRVRLDPASGFGRIPLLPHQMTSRLTDAADVIVLCHLGVPQVDAASWSITVDGLVERPRALSLAELRTFPYVEIEAFHQCAGNPMEPSRPTQRVSNVLWGGYRLADVVAAVRPRGEAKYLWSFGADWGTFDGIAIDAYAKDLPLARIGEDVLIAESMNGALLTPEHGFPVRLVVPGFYGTNSVKWLTRMTFAAERSDGPFTTRWYNDPIMEDGRPTGRTQPVWSVAPQSIIVDPWPRAQLTLGMPVEIWGWAWADMGVASVIIEGEAGDLRIAAAVEPRRGRSWQRFSAMWRPEKMGRQRLGARAVDTSGVVQPDDGARNAIHWSDVVVK